MAKTYEQIARQIEALQQQADALKQQEAIGVIDRIRQTIEFYELTAADLGFDSGAAPQGGKRQGTKTVAKKAAWRPR